MDARGTCDGRHRARKSCSDPECYLRDPYPATPGEMAEAEALEAHEEEIERVDPLSTAPVFERGVDNVDYQTDRLSVLEHDARNQEHRDSLEAQAIMDRLAAAEPIEFGPGIYRWVCSRPGGYQRTVVAHDLPPAPEGWRWSSALAAAVGGRGALQVSAAVVDASEGAGAAIGPQALQLEITGRTGYCTSLDVLLFARPAEVQR